MKYVRTIMGKGHFFHCSSDHCIFIHSISQDRLTNANQRDAVWKKPWCCVFERGICSVFYLLIEIAEPGTYISDKNETTIIRFFGNEAHTPR